jgi:hypothetical protein
MSDLSTVTDRGEPLAANVRRSDFSKPKLDVTLVSICEGDNCDPLQVAHTLTRIIVTSFFISCNPILDRIAQIVTRCFGRPEGVIQLQSLNRAR